jgi:hypothetical protein
MNGTFVSAGIAVSPSLKSASLQKPAYSTKRNRLGLLLGKCSIRISAYSYYSSVHLGKCPDSASIRPRPLPSKTFPIHHSYIILTSTVLLLDLGRFQFLNSIGLLGRGISTSQGRYLHTEQYRHRINAHRYPCLEWDSNPRSQRSSKRRQFMV